MKRMLWVVWVALAACGDDSSMPEDAALDGPDAAVDSALDSEGLDSAFDSATDADDVGPIDGAADAAPVDPRTSLAGPLTSSTRLEIEYIAADGPDTFTGFYDTVRDESCRMSVAEDGEYRCLPVGGVDIFEHFTDDTCTARVYYHSNRVTCPLPEYMVADDETVCPERHPVYVVGDAIADGTQLYWLIDGSCLPVTSPISSFDPYFTTLVPASEFESATVVELGRAGEIAIEVLETAEGAQSFHRLAHSTGQTCAPELATDDTARCLPTGATRGGAYSDPACTMELARVDSGACEIPDHAREREPGCDVTVTVHALGPEVTTTYRNSGASCVENTFNFSYAELDGVEDPASFEATPLETGPGSRLVERRFAIGDDYGARDALFDTTLDATCEWLHDTNGDLRCIPRSAGVIINGSLFRDRSCVLPLATIGGSPCARDYAVDSVSVDCEPTRYDVFSVGERYTGSVYRRSGGICTLLTRPSELGLAFFRPGERIAPDDLVLGTPSRR